MITRRGLLAAAAGLAAEGALVGFQNPITGGQGALIRPAVKSPNYVPGVSGWTINRDGSAEFNNVTVRGTIVASTFQGTDFQIDQNGAFFYSAAPAVGDLIATVTRGAGTDGHTNQYLAGFTSYNPPNGGFVQTNGGVLTLGVMAAGVPDTTHAATFAGGTNGQAQFTSGTSNVNTAAVETVWVPGTASAVSGQSGTPHTLTVSSAVGPAADHWFSGAAIKTTPGGVLYTWQTPGVGGAPAYGTNWSGSTTFNGTTTATALRYRLDAEDNLWIIGCFKAGAVAPGQTVFTLPAAYTINATNMFDQIFCLKNAAGTLTPGMIRIGSNGNVDVLSALGTGITTNAEYYVNGKVPLRNIG